MKANKIVGISLVVGFVLSSFIFTLVASGNGVTAAAGVLEPGSRHNGEEYDSRNLNVAPAGNCRYGVSAWTSEYPWLVDFGAGWFLDWHVHNPTGQEPTEYMPMVRIEQDKDVQGNRLDTYTVRPLLTDAPGGLGYFINKWPGAIWIIGNEPDRGPNPGNPSSGQDNTMPDIFATAYKEIYDFIKGHDPDALVAIGGLVEVTPGRLKYLDLFWQAYIKQFGTSPPIDVWTMHLYILPEVEPDGQPNDIANVALGTDPALGIRSSGNNPANCSLDSVYCVAEHDDMDEFEEQVLAMRTWMRDHGQRQKPLLLSEYSQIYPYDLGGGTCFEDEYGNCFDPPRVSAFMLNSFDFLEGTSDPKLGFTADNNRLIQQWLWFSVETDGVGIASNLVEDGSLTEVGETFQNWVQAQDLTINLRPDPLVPIVKYLPPGQLTTNADLVVNTRNNGTIGVGEAFTVTFRYPEGGWFQEIGSSVIPAPTETFPGLTGCATRAIPVGATWQNLGAGRHDYYVLVDSELDIPEDGPGEADNIANGYVFVGTTQIMLPLVLLH